MSGTRRVGVVGAGRMGELHARTISEHPLLALGGVADIDESRAKTVADRFDSDAYSDHTDLYKQTLDGVVVATPESAHGPPVRDATEWGYDILLEKPISDNPEESHELVDKCRVTGVDVLVGFTLRFDTRYGELKRRVDAGEFGDIVSMHAERSVVTEEARRMQRSHPLLYQTIHDIDFMCRLKDADVKQVYADAAKQVFTDSDVTDVVFSNLRFADGTIASVETGSIMPESSPAENQASFHFKGTDGMARLAVPGGEITVTVDRYETPDTSLFPRVNGRLAGAIAREMDHFGAILRDEEAPTATLADAERAEAVAYATLASLESGEPEPVPDPANRKVILDD